MDKRDKLTGRVREIVDRLPGFRVDSVGSGRRYPYMKTKRKNINILVSHSDGEDWIGVAAIGERAKDELYRGKTTWENRGYKLQQKTRDSHKQNITFRKKFSIPVTGGIKKEMIDAFNDLKKWLG